MSRRLLIPMLLVLVGLSGCGKKGPPRPPLPAFPVEPTAARTRQAGEMVEFMLTLPTQRLDGRAIDAFRGLKIFRRVEPAPREGDAPVVVARTAMSEAQPVQVLSADELADLVPGEIFWLREPVARVLGDQAPDAGFRVTYWARFLLKGSGWSPPTRPVSLLSGVVVPAPSGLGAATLNQGIQLSWTAAGSGLATGIYRRDPEGAFPFQPMTLVPAGQSSFVDPTVAVGRTYVYGVRATWENDPAAPVSDMAGPVEILMEDHFPPAPPRDLQALVRPDGVDLFWLAGREMDLAGYRVWRRLLPAGPWTLLTPEPIAATSFTHDQVPVGEPAEYAVSAVDRNDPPNESPRGIPVAAEVPMAPPPAQEEMP